MAERLLITCTDSMMKQFLEYHTARLAGRGFEVDVACSNVLGRFQNVLNDLDGIARVMLVSARRSPFSLDNLEAYRELRGIIDRGRYDYIWTNEPVMGVLTRLAARKARRRGTKVIYMAHGFHFYLGGPIKYWLTVYPVERLMARLTDRLVTINREDERLARHFPCKVSRIHGVGADGGRFRIVSPEDRARLRAELGLEGFVILNVGELNANKNQRTAILALKRLLGRCPEARLLIAGKGDEREELERLVRAEGLEEHVAFLGYTDRVADYLKACDAVVACSHREGLPMNVVEAMLCGRPVVASRNRGHRELIREGVNGWLADARDADGFAERLFEVYLADGLDAKAIRDSVDAYIITNVENEIADLFGPEGAE